MYIAKISVILLLSVIIINSCAVYDPGKEQVLPDLAPPKDYNPVFVRDVKDINSWDIQSPQLFVSRIDASSPENVKLYTHLIDRNSVYLTNAAKGDWFKRWCELTIRTGSQTTIIDKFTIREITPAERVHLAIALVLDHSGSMGADRAYACQDAVLDFINSKRTDDAIAVIKYDGKVKLESPLTTSASVSNSNFSRNGLEGFGGLTAINDAIINAVRELSKADDKYQRVVAIFTDGFDNSSKISLDSTIAYAKQNNVIICAIDFGYGINKGYMKQYAEATNGMYQHVYKKDEFKLVFDDIYKRFENYYLIEFEQPDFGEHLVTIKLCTPKEDISNSFIFNNLPDIGFINLLNVYFDVDKSTIKKESDKAIKRVAAMMKVYPGIVIELRGHTDSTNRTGDPDYNIKLSQSRADAVKSALVKEGIAERRILTRGFGEHMPKADNTTPEGRAKNRRTEFIILEK